MDFGYFKSFVTVCKITMSDFFSMIRLMYSFISCVVAPGNDFKTLKYSLRDWFKLRLIIFRTIVSNYNNSFFSFFGRRYITFFIRMMTRPFNYLLFCFFFSNFFTNSPTAVGLILSILLSKVMFIFCFTNCLLIVVIILIIVVINLI